LVEMLAAHDVERRYDALVWGHPESPRGVIDAPIGRSVRRPTRMSVREGGRVARTAYEVVDTFREPDVARLACQLETGRTHQIRVHLQAIGHPVVGDAAYGGQRSAITLDRPFLHAGGLAFAHPITGEPVAVTEPLPHAPRARVSRSRGGSRWRRSWSRCSRRSARPDLARRAGQSSARGPSSGVVTTTA